MTTERMITRGNTVYFDFVFYDEEDAIVTDVTTAAVQLTYPGFRSWETETVSLTESSPDVWSGQWDSTKARAGWVEYHAHAHNGVGNFADDGRFRLPANRANLDHDRLPSGGTQSDYELTP